MPDAAASPPIPAPPNRSIALVGLMGAGKSTVGRKLAERLSLPFVDVDREIEQAAGLDIATLFQLYGEAEFRDGECRVIARLVDGPVQVIATGGGAFMSESTRALLKAHCHVIWLDAAPEVLAGRVHRRGHRPLLGEGDPLPVLTRLAAARNAAYGEAHLRIEVTDCDVEAVLARILEGLAGLGV
jgi:shikimate kinase